MIWCDRGRPLRSFFYVDILTNDEWIFRGKFYSRLAAVLSEDGRNFLPTISNRPIRRGLSNLIPLVYILAFDH